MTKYRLKDNHPIMHKVAQIFEMCQELGISFRYSRAGYMMVDVEGADAEFFIDDVDSSLPIQAIPHPVEYKITYEK